MSLCTKEEHVYHVAAPLATVLSSIVVFSSTASATPNETLVFADQLGLEADSLALSGFTGTDVAQILSRLSLASSAHTQISSLVAEGDQLRASIATVTDQLRADPLDESLAAQLAAADASLVSNAEAIDAAKESLFTLLFDGMATEHVAAWRRCRSHAGTRLPLAFRVVAWSEADLRSAEAAVVVEERSVQLDEPVPENVQTVLATIRARADVALASSLHAAHVTEIKDVIQSWSE